MSEVGKEIRRLRLEKCWSQGQLGVYAGSSQPTVNQIETGRRNPSTTTLQKLARALGVEVADLFPKAQIPLPLEEAQANIPEGPAPQSMQELLERVGARTRHLAQPIDDLRHSCERFSRGEVLTFYDEVLAEKQLIGPVLDQRHNTPAGEDLLQLNTLWLEQFYKGWAAAGAADRQIKEIAAAESEEQADALRHESAKRAQALMSA